MEFQDSDADQAWLTFIWRLYIKKSFRMSSLKHLFGTKEFLEQKTSLNIWTLKEVSDLWLF